MYTYKAKLIKVIEGDTIDAQIDLGFGVYMQQRVKLFGITTPDSRSKDIKEKELGYASKQRITELLGKQFLVTTIMNKRGKVGRVLGIIKVISSDSTEININDTLVSEGFATKHSGNLKDV